MLKLPAAVILACVCLLTGYSCSLSLKKRRDCLDSFAKSVALCQNELAYKNATRTVILSQLKRREFAGLDEYFDAIIQGNEPGDTLPGALSDAEKELITEFFAQLGASDIKSQLSMCELCGRKCDEFGKEAREKYRTLSALYLNLGAAAAVVAAILIL